MDESRNQVRSDATPFASIDNSRENINHDLDFLMDELTEDDYRSVLFLLLDRDVNNLRDYLYLIKRNKSRMKEEFREKYHKHLYKENMLVEVLGTMQKYKLLNVLKTCQHYFKNEVEDANVLDCFWKCLYNICEQLSDAQVTDIKNKLLIPDSITCAEQLFCLAVISGKFSRNNLSKLEEILEQHYPKCYELLMNYKKSSKVSYYPMTHPVAGLAVIFCHTNFESVLTERYESKKDAEGLKAVWEKFGFKAQIFYNKTKEEVQRILWEISSRDHSSYDAFVACYLSHGSEGVVYTYDCQPIDIEELISTIANNCPSLVGKPKLFFIQACQGTQILNDVLNYSRKEPSERIQIDLSFLKSCEETPLYSDVLLVLSTIEKFASYSCPGDNSWFIGELIKALNEDGENLTMMSIVTNVNKIVSLKEGIESDTRQRCKQLPVVKFTLRNELKLKRRR